MKLLSFAMGLVLLICGMTLPLAAHACQEVWEGHKLQSVRNDPGSSNGYICFYEGQMRIDDCLNLGGYEHGHICEVMINNESYPSIMHQIYLE